MGRGYLGVSARDGWQFRLILRSMRRSPSYLKDSGDLDSFPALPSTLTVDTTAAEGRPVGWNDIGAR